MYSKNSVITVDTTAVWIAARLLLLRVYTKCAVGELRVYTTGEMFIIHDSERSIGAW